MQTKQQFLLWLVLLGVSLVSADSQLRLAPDASSSSSSLDNDDDQPLTSSSCASIQDCRNCTNTYTCHWCHFDNACHAKGSFHGCSWGASCSAPQPPKENTTCASHTTCGDCALSSHLCHWCEHDNACHAVGSRFGCAVGVDCYANHRCRREEPEKFGRFVVTEIPPSRLIVVLLFGALLLSCCTLCYTCFGNIRGAYGDLATLTLAASVAPLSIVGGHQMQVERYETQPPLETHTEEDQDADPTAVESTDTTPDATNTEDAENPQSNAASPLEIDNADASAGSMVALEPTHRDECERDPRDLLLLSEPDLQTPLLLPSSPTSYNGMPALEESRHMKALHRACSFCYALGILITLLLTGAIIFFYPKRPIYNVCNDAVAWKEIVEHQRGKGSFAYDGNQVGTYEIPSVTVASMAVTDLMLIARVSPDRYQALQMAQAYYRGNLELEADFQAQLTVPFFGGNRQTHI